MPNRTADPIGWLIATVQKFGMEYLFGRYYGLYRGIVIDNKDPEKRGRVRIQTPAIGQIEASMVPDNLWASYCGPGTSVGSHGAHGLFCPPEIDDQVFVMFEGGRPEKPVYMGGWWTKDHEGTDLDHEEAKYRGFRTAAGHYLRFSDEDGDVHVTLAKGDGDGGVSGALISLQDDGGILVSDDDGQHVWLNKAEGVVQLIQKDGSLMKLGKSEATMINSDGTSLSLDGKDVLINCAGAFTVTAGKKVYLNAKAVDVGANASEPAVCGTQLATAFGTHLHPTSAPGAPTAPPTPPPFMAGNPLSTSVKVAK